MLYNNGSIRYTTHFLETIFSQKIQFMGSNKPLCQMLSLYHKITSLLRIFAITRVI